MKVLPREELKKLERKAKAFMLTKEIPQGKVEVVRSILSNKMLLDEERYRAIIEILKNCPDKVETELQSRKIPGLSSTKQQSDSISSEKPVYIGPSVDSFYVNDLYKKYKDLNLFKKRLLAPSSSRFGFKFRKRLIPTKKLLKLMREIKSFQEKIISRLSLIQQMLLNDILIEDPTVYNYTKILNVWLMDNPLSGFDFEAVKWMDRPHFESEIKNWCITFFSVSEIDSGTKESIISAIEAKLREMDDLIKEPILPEDSDWKKTEKDKRNFDREKIIYEFMMILRSFIPSIDPSDGLLSKHISTRYGIESPRELARLLLENLVFARETSLKNIIRYYSVSAPKISTTEWNASDDLLKLAGKDSESKKKRYIETLRSTISDYDELYGYISMRNETTDFVRKAFDEQWRLINRRKQDGNGIYERDFFSFVYECLSYFLTVYAPFINGSIVPLIIENGTRIEKSLFSSSYFESELSVLLKVQGELFHMKSTNPNYIITHAEAKRIAAGQIPSMNEIDSYLKQLGASFYSIGNSLSKLISRHDQAIKNSSDEELAIPIDKTPDGEYLIAAIPLHDSRVLQIEKQNPAQKLLIGMRIIGATGKDGVLNSITAFCLQFAQECFDRNISNDLSYRKELLRKIDEAELK